MVHISGSSEEHPAPDCSVLFDLALHLRFKRSGSSRGAGSSSTSGYMVKVYILSWAEDSKLKLYTDNIFLEFGLLLQQWVLQTAANIKDIRLEFMDKEKTQRIVQERELQQAILDDNGGSRLYGSTFQIIS